MRFAEQRTGVISDNKPGLRWEWQVASCRELFWRRRTGGFAWPQGVELSVMGTLLVRNARLLVTMDEPRRETKGGGVFVRDGSLSEWAPRRRYLPRQTG